MGYTDFKIFLTLTGRLPRTNSFDYIERKIAFWFVYSNQYDKIEKLVSKYFPMDLILIDYFNAELSNWLYFYGDTYFTLKPKYCKLELEAMLWHNTILVEYKNNILPDYKYNILSKIPRWDWHNFIILNHKVRICTYSFIESYFTWIYCYDNKYSPLNKKMVKWQKSIRKDYMHNKLPQTIIDIMNNTYGWSWEENDVFYIMVEKWRKFYAKNNRTPYKLNNKEKELARWQMRMRRKNRENKLSTERIYVLNNTNGWIWEQTFQKKNTNCLTINQTEFDICLYNFTYFYERKNMPSIYSEDQTEKNLALWRYGILYMFKNGKLPKYIIDKLNKLSFNFFDLYYKIVMFKYNFCDNAYLWEYFNSNKRLSLKSTSYLEQQIYRWQYKVRHQWKQGILSVENIDILNQVEGWKWTCYKDKPVKLPFEQHANLWRDFYIANKRTPVYRNFDEKKLATWQQYTRKRYRIGKLTKEQIDILKSIEGWKFE